MLTVHSVCSVTLGSLWLEQVEKDQNSFRVVEVVQATPADAFCRCSILGFSILLARFRYLPVLMRTREQKRHLVTNLLSERDWMTAKA